MTGANPIVTAAQAASTASPSTTGSAQSQPSNQLGPNAFITLLTAQLQAQDPLNPMDPNQMVTELTSMNTLQQIIQIRQDMDSLVSAGQGTSGNGNTGRSGNTTASSPSSTMLAAIGSNTDASAPASAMALKAGLAALTTQTSLTSARVSNLTSPFPSKSQLS